MSECFLCKNDSGNGNYRLIDRAHPEDVKGITLCEDCYLGGTDHNWPALLAGKTGSEKREEAIRQAYAPLYPKIRNKKIGQAAMSVPVPMCGACGKEPQTFCAIKNEPATITDDYGSVPLCHTCYRVRQSVVVDRMIKKRMTIVCSEPVSQQASACVFPSWTFQPDTGDYCFDTINFIRKDGTLESVRIESDGIPAHESVYYETKRLFIEQVTNGGQVSEAAWSQCVRLATYRLTEAAKGLHALNTWLYGSRTKYDRKRPMVLNYVGAKDQPLRRA